MADKITEPTTPPPGRAGGSFNAVPQQAKFDDAWAYLIGWMRNAAEHGEQLEASAILDLMQEIHDQYHLPPYAAPKRDA